MNSEESACDIIEDGVVSIEDDISAYRLFGLATNSLTNFSQSGEVSDLDDAILLYRQVLTLIPAPHPERPNTLNNLAAAHQTHFDSTNQLSDLDEAIAIYREVLELVPRANNDRLGSLCNFAAALRTRFDQTKQLGDLDQAAVLYREALELSPEEDDRPSMLLDLADTLDTRFDQTKQLTDLNEMMILYREVLHLLPPSHSSRLAHINSLANTLEMRFYQTRQLDDLSDRISLYRQALQQRSTSSKNRLLFLDNLANALSIRWNEIGEFEDLEESIALHRELLELLPAPNPLRSVTLHNLATTLSVRYNHKGRITQPMDIEESVALHREALSLRPVPHPDRSDSLDNLAIVLAMRFGETGQLADLDEAASLHREALDLEPAPHPDRSGTLNNFSTTLHTRFGQMGQAFDLDEAITLSREAIELQPFPHADRPLSLDNLGTALFTKYSELHGEVDLDEVVALHREAIDLLPPPHAYRWISLNNLANALSLRYDQEHDLSDLNEAVDLHREVLELLPQSNRSIPLNNLASALSKRFDQTHQLHDLEEAITACRKSLDILPSGHRNSCYSFINLGSMLMDVYLLTNESKHLEDAMTSFCSAVRCDSAPALKRFDAARRWARHAENRHESALEAYQTAIEFLPRLAMLGLDVQSRQEILVAGSDGLARNAAACAIRAGKFEKAIEMLEEGRTIFWSQALQLRTPLDDLRLVAKDLADKLEGLSRILEHGAFRDVSRTMLDAPRKVMSMEQEAVYYRRLNEEWLTTLDEVRKLEGFHDFLRPKSLFALQRAAANGPVVVLNVTESGCDALTMTSSHVDRVPLPFTLETAKNLLEKMRIFPSNSYRGSEKPQYRHFSRKPKTPEDIFPSVLATLWQSVVEPIIHFLDIKKSNLPPRIWWCPTGPFAFLPIHAAGIYNNKKGVPSDRIFDYVISSYTPTLSALLLPPPPASAEPFKMMAVIQPATPGYPVLPQTRDELRRIEGRVPSTSLIKFGLPEAPATVESVVSHLSASSIVHLACHGEQDTGNPLESAIILEDGRLKVSRIMQQSMSNARLVFLSACQTAMGDQTLPDEAIHLAATLLFAGFRGAIATMWSIADVDGPPVSDNFYNELFKSAKLADGEVHHHCPDTTRAAKALHLAVADLRDKGCPFARWVPFVHMGS